MKSGLRVAVIMTCFNRKELTLAAMRAAKASSPPGVSLHFFITDDSSTDGTSDAIKAEFPDATVLDGSGDLYWNGGMRLAWERAAKSGADFYLWLNDDLNILPSAIGDMLSTWNTFSKAHPNLIVVGHTLDPESGDLTYGGLRRTSRLSRLRLSHISKSDFYCDTMNGNLVLIPSIAVNDLGINSPRFTHSFGDIDYGFRATRAGFTLVQCANAVGLQERNPNSYSRPKSLAFRDMVAFATHPKGMPLREWLYFCREHGGWKWPLNFLAMYIKPFLFRSPR